jgi:hypothetical protein
MSRLGSKQQNIHAVLNPRGVSPDDLRFKLIECDRLAATDTRTEAQKWLGDPPPWQSALARRKQHTTGVIDPWSAVPRLIDHHASRALAYRARAIELAQQAKREDDPGQRRFLLDLARNMVNVADALEPLPPDEPLIFRSIK